MNIQDRTPADFVRLIESQFEEYCGKVDRVDVKWGKWSAVMNREIRRRIDNKDKDTPQLAMVYNYWVTISQLLDLRFKYRRKLFGRNKIKKKIREAQRLKEAMNL